MRRTGCLMMALMMLLCTTALAAAGDDFQLGGKYVTGKDTGVYPVNFMLWSGPGYEFDMYDYDFCCDLDTSRVKVYSQVWNGGMLWILVEAQHRTAGKVRGYTKAIDENGENPIAYDGNAVPWEDPPGSFESIYECHYYEVTSLRCGPGTGYAYNGSVVYPDDYGHVVLLDGDWALVEGVSHAESGHKARGWIRFGDIQY